ncbi:hypothetical protein Taro_024244 [Colocasia esculenta]|uniref:AT-hook motif nuclear-localized protein n=1 Tax=Colocasia esculenta TaxID=4460 RepID=A0A843UZS3_COLES|nr:hypothetical protein [Colocasia esculenta]
MDDREPSRMASSDHPAAMLCPDAYSSGSLSNPTMVPSSLGMIHGMHLSFNPVAPCMSKPTELSSSLYHGDATLGIRPGAGLSMSEPVKKKRGRPRKYGADGSMVLALTSPSSTTSSYSVNLSSEQSLPKRRGRPPGSGKKQQLDALGSPGSGFTPHVITVKAGEDVASKIMAFSQQGPRAVCIISANGAISNATLRQAATSGGTATYEGLFEIVSLSGSFMPTENGGTRGRTGGLSVSLAEGGRVLGGVVAGMLTAATPVQVVVASFIAEEKKPKLDPWKHEPSSAPQAAGFGVTSTSPPSHGTSSESSGNKPGSPLNQQLGTCNSFTQQLPSTSVYTSVSWPQSANQHRHDSEMRTIHN